MSTTKQSGYLFPLIIMITLFFLLGFFTIMSNSMIDFLKERFTLTTFQSQFVNLAFYGAYLLSIPVGFAIYKLGYRNSVVLGMLIITAGLGLFVPAIGPNFNLFLLPFFLIGLGDVFLNVAVNPYVFALGPKESSASRLNLAAALNSLATVVAPLFVSALIVDRALAAEESGITDIVEIVRTGVFWPAVGTGLFALLIAIILIFLRLPEITGEEGEELSEADQAKEANDTVWKHKNVTFGLVAIGMYVSVEVGVPSLLMFYYDEIRATMVMPEFLSFLGTGKTSMLALYWSGLMIGRFMGSWLNRVFVPNKLLAVFALLAAALLGLSFMTSGNFAFLCMLCIGLFHSIMWPNINDIGLTNVGALSKKASGILCTGVAVAAVYTLLMGKVADMTGSFKFAYALLFINYAYIIFYALMGPRMSRS